MALQQSYYRLWFVSFRLSIKSGRRDPIQLKLKANQTLPPEIISECKARKQQPFNLLTECCREYFTNLTEYPVGTVFLLKAKLTDREGGTMFFYSYFGWRAIKLVKPR